LTSSERQALAELRKNNNIIIKPADKGGAVVIMDRELYIAEGMRQLSNPKYYKQLDTAIFPESVDLINNVVRKLLLNKFISKKQYDFLCAKPTARQRHFYLLPKIHKDFNKWPNPKMPEGRPIVADCGSESYEISKFIDHWLQPLATSHESYIKDTYDFVQKIRDVQVDENDLLVTGDVTSLYTNMKIHKILESVQEAFSEAPDRSRPDEEIIELLEVTLTRNDFEFDNKVFLQICGTAMGKTYAPSLANIYLRKFDEAAKNGFKIKPKIYWRYLDDIKLVWPGTREDLAEYQNYLNTIIDGITVELKARDRIIEFLDTQVYKTYTSDGRWVLKTKPYFKPTDTHQLLHAASFHPRHTTRGILKSQFIRFKRISSSLYDYNEAARILGTVLIKRGYSSRLFRRLKLDVWYHFDLGRRNNSQKSDKNILPIITHYDRVQSSLNMEWRRIINENPIFHKYRKISAYKIHKNLRQLIVRSRLTNPRTITASDLTDTDRTNVRILAEILSENSKITDEQKITRCMHKMCKCCRHIQPADAVYIPHINQKILIEEAMNCSSRNIIYVIICTKCNKVYVGETKNKLKDRMNKHRSDIRLHRSNSAVAIHFNGAAHNLGHLRVFPLEKIHVDDDKTRKNRESFWIKKLDSKYPKGLNIYPI